jgi:hypothetical protein
MQWLRTTSFFTDFKREPAEDSKIYLIIYNLDKIDDFDEKTIVSNSIFLLSENSAMSIMRTA